MSLPNGRWLRRSGAGVAVVAVLSGLGACRSVTEESEPGYQPATLGQADAAGVKPVTFTADAAQRVALQTAPVLARGGSVAVPYAALIYDKKGASWVYTEPTPLTYRRAKVAVTRVADDEAVLSTGPRPGTRVVTVGATEVYGAELGIASKH